MNFVKWSLIQVQFPFDVVQEYERPLFTGSELGSAKERAWFANPQAAILFNGA